MSDILEAFNSENSLVRWSALMPDFSILAPVPKEFLESGEDVVNSKSYVSFGSQKWELFRRIEQMRGAASIRVLLYASYDDDADRTRPFTVTWRGEYIGSTEDADEKRRDDEEGYRPKIAEKYDDDAPGEWAVFWRVRNLTPLPDAEHVAVAAFRSYETGKPLANAAPRGPTLVEET